MTSDPDGTRSLPPIENPFLLSNGQLTDLGHLDGRFGGAVGINNAGQIAGTTPYNNQFELAAFYNGSTTITLGSLPGTSSSQAVALNNAGQIAGFCYNIGIEGYRAFLYTKGTMQELSIPGDVNGAALAINDAGDIVGWSAAADGVGRAFLHRNGKKIDLNSLPGIAGSGWILQTALEINNAGQIVVSGSFNGQRRYAMLTPP